MGCNYCESPEENLHGLCPECAETWRERAYETIPSPHLDADVDDSQQTGQRTGQNTLGDFT